MKFWAPHWILAIAHINARLCQISHQSFQEFGSEATTFGALRKSSQNLAPANWKALCHKFCCRVNCVRRCYCKPTIHCNKSRDPVELLEKFLLRRKLRPAL